MKIKLPIGRKGKGPKKEKQSKKSGQKKGLFGKLKIPKRGQKSEELQEQSSEQTQPIGNLLSGLKSMIPSKRKKAEFVPEPMPEQVGMQEDEAEQIGEQEFVEGEYEEMDQMGEGEFVEGEYVESEQIGETEDVMEEFEEQELVEERNRIQVIESKKKSKGKKKFIIVPVIVGVFFAVWFMGLIPENEFLPTASSILGVETPALGMTGTGTDGEQIIDLQFRVDYLEEQIDELDSIEQISGPQGIQGSKGTQGSEGIQGPQGEIGASTIPIMFSLGERSTSLVRPLYIGLGSGSENFNAVKMLSPINGRIMNLYAISSNDPGVEINVTLVRNGLETGLSCKFIPSTEFTQKCSNTEDEVVIKAGETFAIKLEKGSLVEANRLSVQVSVTLERP